MNISNALTCVFLMMLLTACASTPTPNYSINYSFAPEEYTKECTVELRYGITTKELLEMYKAELDQCNDQLKAIRTWKQLINTDNTD